MDSKRALSMALSLMLLVALAHVALAGVPLRTGQKKCWNVAGAIIPCAGTGQDGELRNGAKRGYADNGNGTITDEGTGLVWEKLNDGGGIHDVDASYTWANAFAKIATLNSPPCFAGHCDWRLPNVTELQSIVDYGRFGLSIAPVFQTPCIPGCGLASCSCTSTETYYWTSSTYVSYLDTAWIVDFIFGFQGGANKPEPHCVRAVRGHG